MGEEGEGCRGQTHPATSLTTSLTKAVRLLRWPLVRETRGLTTRGVVFCSLTKHPGKSQPVGSSIVCGGTPQRSSRR